MSSIQGRPDGELPQRAFPTVRTALRKRSWSPNTPAGPHCGVRAGRFRGATPLAAPG